MKLLPLLTLCGALASGGCSTVMTLADGSAAPYSGVRKDFQLIQEGEFYAIFAAIDLPLSFLADTLLLPVTFNQE